MKSSEESKPIWTCIFCSFSSHNGIIFLQCSVSRRRMMLFSDTPAQQRARHIALTAPLCMLFSSIFTHLWWVLCMYGVVMLFSSSNLLLSVGFGVANLPDPETAPLNPLTTSQHGDRLERFTCQIASAAGRGAGHETVYVVASDISPTKRFAPFQWNFPTGFKIGLPFQVQTAGKKNQWWFIFLNVGILQRIHWYFSQNHKWDQGIFNEVRGNEFIWNIFLYLRQFNR